MAGTNVCVSCPGSAAPRRRATRKSYRRKSYRRPSYRRRAPARRRTLPMRRAPRPISKFELGQINPFDKNVYGAKIPDSNTQPSTTSVAEDRFVFTGSATDMAQCKAFFPNVDSPVTVSTDSSSTAWTWSAGYGGVTNSSVRAAFVASFAGIRPVAHGVRISSQAAPTSITGFVHVAVYPLETQGNSTWNLPVNISQMAQLPWYRRYTIASLTQTPVIVCNKFLDCTATRYHDPASAQVANSSATQFQFGSSWCAILVAVEGQPVLTSNLSVENLTHFETIPAFGTGSGSVFGTSPAAPFSTQKLEAVSRVAGHVGAVFNDDPMSLQERVREVTAALSSGAGNAAGELFDSYIRPAAWGAGYSATMAGAGYLAGRFARYAGMPGINTAGRLAE